MHKTFNKFYTIFNRNYSIHVMLWKIYYINYDFPKFLLESYNNLFIEVTSKNTKFGNWYCKIDRVTFKLFINHITLSVGPMFTGSLVYFVGKYLFKSVTITQKVHWI